MDRRTIKITGKYPTREALESACRQLKEQGVLQREISDMVGVLPVTVSRILNPPKPRELVVGPPLPSNLLNDYWRIPNIEEIFAGEPPYDYYEARNHRWSVTSYRIAGN